MSFIWKKVLIVMTGALMILVGMSGCNKQKKDTFGKEVLKINGKFVDMKIFQEEKQLFINKNIRSAVTVRQPEEEHNDIILENVIQRVLVDSYISNQNLTVSAQDVTNYMNLYVKPPLYLNMDAHDEVPESYLDLPVKPITYIKIQPYLLRLKIIPELAKSYGIKADPKEVDKEYNRQLQDNYMIVGRHIALSNDQTQLAEKIVAEYKSGKDFGELAKQYSLDTVSAMKGGRIGNILHAPIVKDFDKKLVNVKDGDIIPPFKTDHSLEIVLVEKVVRFNHTKEDIENNMLMNNFITSPAYTQWIDKLKTENKVEVIAPTFKAFRLYKEKNYAEAVKFYEKFYRSTKSMDALQRTIFCYKKIGEYKKASALCQEAIQKFPNTKLDFYLYDAEIRFLMGDTNGGLLDMQRAEAAAGKNIIMKNNVADTFLRLGMTNEMIRLTNY